jgi:hypothetical protein
MPWTFAKHFQPRVSSARDGILDSFSRHVIKDNRRIRERNDYQGNLSCSLSLR